MILSIEHWLTNYLKYFMSLRLLDGYLAVAYIYLKFEINY